jgi:hypothetical protein
MVVLLISKRKTTVVENRQELFSICYRNKTVDEIKAETSQISFCDSIIKEPAAIRFLGLLLN